MVFPHIIPNLIVGRLAFRSSHIQFLHVNVHFDVSLDIEFGQKEDRFDMPRSWKKVHRLHLLRMIPMLFEPCGISCGGGGVAADIDPAGGHLDDGGKSRLVAALAGRVEHDDIRPQALSGEAGRSLTGVGAEEAALGGDGVAHPGGVGLGAVNSLGHDLHADELPAAVGHGETDGTHAAVEVEQNVRGLQLGVLGSDAVEPLSGQCVDLIEGEGAESDRHTAKSILDVARAVERDGLFTQDDIGLLGVDVDEDGRNIAELLPQRGHELLAVGKLRAGADEADHDLAAVCTPAQEDMPNKALAALLVVGLDAVGGEEAAERVADVVQNAGL